MKRSEYSTEFLSEDLYLCSFLLTKGHQILGFTKTSRKIAIRFPRSPTIERDVMIYYNQGKAIASHLFDSFRRLKDMVFQAVKENSGKENCLD